MRDSKAIKLRNGRPKKGHEGLNKIRNNVNTQIQIHTVRRTQRLANRAVIAIMERPDRVFANGNFTGPGENGRALTMNVCLVIAILVIIMRIGGADRRG